MTLKQERPLLKYPPFNDWRRQNGNARCQCVTLSAGHRRDGRKLEFHVNFRWHGVSFVCAFFAGEPFAPH